MARARIESSSGYASMRSIRPEQLALLQGGYFLFTGIWPLLSRRTFEALTGPKQDFWLAQTVGVLVSSVGSALVLTGKRGQVGQEARWLAASSAAGLAVIDILARPVGGSRTCISPMPPSRPHSSLRGSPQKAEETQRIACKRFAETSERLACSGRADPGRSN